MVSSMSETYTLLAILTIAGLGSGALIALSLTALVRRRSWSYFLVTLAIGSLLIRTFLGVVMVGGYLPLDIHHLLEHFLDVLMIALLFAAIYVVRTAKPEPSFDGSHHSQND